MMWPLLQLIVGVEGYNGAPLCSMHTWKANTRQGWQ